MATQFILRLAATAAATTFLLSASPAFADEADDSILRSETQIRALNPADATAFAGQDYALALQRLEEARSAERDRHNDQAVDRAEEASLLAQLVREQIKLSALQKSQHDLEASLAALSRETQR
jgi:septal ring factor EnvC (AmiA/AmiB activator)